MLDPRLGTPSLAAGEQTGSTKHDASPFLLSAPSPLLFFLPSVSHHLPSLHSLSLLFDCALLPLFTCLACYRSPRGGSSRSRLSSPSPFIFPFLPTTHPPNPSFLLNLSPFPQYHTRSTSVSRVQSARVSPARVLLSSPPSSLNPSPSLHPFSLTPLPRPTSPKSSSRPFQPPRSLASRENRAAGHASGKGQRNKGRLFQKEEKRPPRVEEHGGKEGNDQAGVSRRMRARVE